MLVHCWKSLVKLPNIFILLMVDKALLVCLNIMPFKDLRYSGGGLKFFVWKISDFIMLDGKTELFEERRNDLITTKNIYI